MHAFVFDKGKLCPQPPVNESQLFELSIPEGCVMNKLIQPGNLSYDHKGRPRYKIACCLLKEEVRPKVPYQQKTTINGKPHYSPNPTGRANDGRTVR
jgi:hypothetical protein